MENQTPEEVKRGILTHYLASLAYHLQKALRGAPESFANFRAKPGVRTPHELVFHITNVLGYARTFFVGGQWRPEKLPSFDAEVLLSHEILASLRKHFLTGSQLNTITFEQLLQGPLSDAMTHIGQLSLLRRLHDCPVPPENFVYANISADNVRPYLPKPASPDKIWERTDRLKKQGGITDAVLRCLYVFWQFFRC